MGERESRGCSEHSQVVPKIGPDARAPKRKLVGSWSGGRTRSFDFASRRLGVAELDQEGRCLLTVLRAEKVPLTLALDFETG